LKIGFVELMLAQLLFFLKLLGRATLALGIYDLSISCCSVYWTGFRFA